MKQRVRIIDMIIDYGRPRAAAVVKKAVEDTIKKTRKEWFEKKFVVFQRGVFIPNRLEMAGKGVFLVKYDKNGQNPTNLFCKKEIFNMYKTMPAFDKYFEVKEA